MYDKSITFLASNKGPYILHFQRKCQKRCLTNKRKFTVAKKIQKVYRAQLNPFSDKSINLQKIYRFVIGLLQICYRFVIDLSVKDKSNDKQKNIYGFVIDLSLKGCYRLVNEKCNHTKGLYKMIKIRKIFFCFAHKITYIF